MSCFIAFAGDPAPTNTSSCVNVFRALVANVGVHAPTLQNVPCSLFFASSAPLAARSGRNSVSLLAHGHGASVATVCTKPPEAAYASWYPIFNF